ncbi:MAG TPA: 4Fe-4S dicluster domain-containing protein [Sunxiuqinia sp.]|nr:4Fe-4S dicluster domain-containing protein [Sunxiuqinia sp.]
MGNEKLNASRRNFIRKSALLAGTFMASSAVKPFSAILFAANEPGKTEPWYAIGIDIEKCIGCGNCAKACKSENDVPKDPFYYRSWVEQYAIKNDGTMSVVSPNGGIDGFTQTVPDDEIYKTFFVPKMCNQCYKSPCVQVCPVGATFVSPEGVVLVDEKYCMGCSYCVQACPYGCRYLHPEKKTADKCTLCYHRLKKGLKPACFEVCPTGARIYGDLHDENDELHNFLKDHNTQVLKPHLNTGSKLFYNGLSSEVR